MKFLRLAYYVLIAQLVLSGCAGEGMDETSPSSSEINFDAYLDTNASTRVGETNLASLKETSGFSVFARHTHANGAISDMMDNEHVTLMEIVGDTQIPNIDQIMVLWDSMPMLLILME